MLKQDVIKTIDNLPDTASMEDIIYRIYVLDKHYKALRDIEAGRVYSAEDIRRDILKNI